jgi:hypothetical protein
LSAADEAGQREQLLARLHAHGWRFLRRPLNAFDAAVILVSAMPAVGVDASLLRLARAARLVHFARHSGHLRAVTCLRRQSDGAICSSVIWIW